MDVPPAKAIDVPPPVATDVGGVDVAEDDERADVRVGVGVDEGIDVPAAELEGGRRADEDDGAEAAEDDGELFCRCGRSLVCHTRD